MRTSDVSGVVPGEDGLFTADASVPLGPPSPELIQKQKLLSNGELKRSLWNAVAMESGCKVRRQRRERDLSRRVQMQVPNVSLAPSTRSQASRLGFLECQSGNAARLVLAGSCFCLLEAVRRCRVPVCANWGRIPPCPRPRRFGTGLSRTVPALFFWIFGVLGD